MRFWSKGHLILFAALVLLVSAPALGQLEVVTNDGGLAGPMNPLDANCVREGNYAMRVTTTTGDSSAMFVQAGDTNGFADETVFRGQFWFRPSNMFIRHGRRHILLSAQPGTTMYAGLLGTQAPFRLNFWRNDFTGDRKLNLNCKVNCATPGTCLSAVTQKVNLGNDPTQWSLIQVEWAHNSGSGVFDAVCRVSVIDGAGAGQSQDATVGFANRQYSIDSVKMGFVGGFLIDPQSDGKHCYDSAAFFRTLAP